MAYLVTPHDYEPPGFQQAASDGFNFQVHPMNIKVGDVTTVSISTNMNRKKVSLSW